MGVDLIAMLNSHFSVGLFFYENQHIIKFGDVYRKQISGTAVGKPPASPWTTYNL